MTGLPPVPMHGVKNALLLPISDADGRGQRRADRLRKVGEVSRGIELRKNHCNDVTEVAKQFGVHRSTLYRLK